MEREAIQPASPENNMITFEELKQADNPNRAFLKAFIEKTGVKDWKGREHAIALFALACSIFEIESKSPEAQLFLQMLKADGLAGNASQLGASMKKPAGPKAPLGGLLPEKSEISDLEGLF